MEFIAVDIQKEITIMKTSSCGLSEFETFSKNSELFKYFDKLKQKYPKWDRR